MLATELATTHGYANVMVKGHARDRAREWRKLRPVAQTGQPNLSGWAQLAATFEQAGWTVERGVRSVQ